MSSCRTRPGNLSLKKLQVGLLPSACYGDYNITDGGGEAGGVEVGGGAPEAKAGGRFCFFPFCP